MKSIYVPLHAQVGQKSAKFREINKRPRPPPTQEYEEILDLKLSQKFSNSQESLDNFHKNQYKP